jgi:hypothetical protein
MRKYGPSIDDVIAEGARARAELDLVDGGTLDLAAIAEARAAAEGALVEACAELTRLRQGGARRLAQSVTALLPELGMREGRVDVVLSPLDQPTAAGAESVHIEAALNAGSDRRPLARIASGGELSRVMLALSTVLARHQAVPTLIFDEVDAGVGGAVIPNFSVGMVLLQQAAAAAARFYDFAELTELHHNRKADAPSGTCIKTAELMEDLGKAFNPPQVEEHESLAGCRGGQRPSGLRLHSLRLPGLVAHQEVMFGAPGETYTLRHDTIDRSAYMPGVLLTVRRVRQLSGLVYGLERLL